MIKLLSRPMTNSKMAGFQSAPSSFGEELKPTVFVYNEPGINGTENIENDGDGVGDDKNENANLLSIVKHLIDQGEQYILDREIQSFVDPEVLKQSLDVYPSFFFMTDMEWESNQVVRKANPNDSNWLPDGSKQVLRDYVASGGTIVQTGTVYGWDVDFLNEIFDLNLKAVPDDQDPKNQPWTASENKIWERQTVLESLDLGLGMKADSIKVIPGVDTIDASNINNAEYTSLYGPDEDSLVGVISYGDGKIYYVGSDYRMSGYPTDWGYGPHKGEHQYNNKAFVQEILPAILEQAAKEAKENLPFPQNYKEEDDNNFVVNDGKPLKEDSFEFGPGEDQLINRCSLEITGDGVIDLGPNRDIMQTNMSISAKRLDGGADFDQLILTDDDDNECAEGEKADDKLTPQSMEIDNFERIEVTGGRWQLEGDHRKADVLISGGTMQVPLLKRRLAGLRAKRFQLKDGAEMTVDLSDTDLSSNNLEGRWVVLQANGLANSLANTSLDDAFKVTGADGYDTKFERLGSRLILQLTSSSVG